MLRENQVRRQGGDSVLVARMGGARAKAIDIVIVVGGRHDESETKGDAKLKRGVSTATAQIARIIFAGLLDQRFRAH